MRMVGAALFALAPALGQAADMPTKASEPAPDWIVTVGIEGQTVPAWPGAATNKIRFVALPLVSVRKAGTPPEFFGPRDSLGIDLIDFGAVKFGPALRLVPARRASAYTELNGLGNVDFAVQAGAFAEYWPVPWLRMRGELRQGFAGETGVTGDAIIDAVGRFGALTLSAGPRLTAQSAAATSPYFSITPAQSAASTIAGLPMLPVYDAGGGLYSYGAGTQARYFFTPQWSTLAFIEYERLTGDAANSPLVTARGSPNQTTLGLAFTYSFAMHPLW